MSMIMRNTGEEPIYIEDQSNSITWTIYPGETFNFEYRINRVAMSSGDNKLTDDQQKLLDEFEKMLNDFDLDLDGDFGFFDAGHYYPSPEDLEYPDEPPPVPEKDSKCLHKKKRKVIISNSIKYWYCPDCKGDLGDVEDDS